MYLPTQPFISPYIPKQLQNPLDRARLDCFNLYYLANSWRKMWKTCVAIGFIVSLSIAAGVGDVSASCGAARGAAHVSISLRSRSTLLSALIQYCRTKMTELLEVPGLGSFVLNVIVECGAPESWSDSTTLLKPNPRPPIRPQTCKRISASLCHTATKNVTMFTSLVPDSTLQEYAGSPWGGKVEYIHRGGWVVEQTE